MKPEMKDEGNLIDWGQKIMTPDPIVIKLKCCSQGRNFVDLSYSKRDFYSWLKDFESLG
jgi:hypothetical protein